MFKYIQNISAVHVGTDAGTLAELKKEVTCLATGSGVVLIEMDVLESSESAVAKKLIETLTFECPDNTGLIYITL
jgi:hypothetical protein